VNDRRILFGLLAHCGFPAEVHERALITIDKLDKIGPEGVVEELRGIDAECADRIGAVLQAVAPALAGSGIPLEREAMLAVLPEGAATDAVNDLAVLGEA